MKTGRRTGKLSFHLAARIMIPLTVLIAVTFIFTSISLRSATEQMQDEIMTENAGSIANTVATYFADYRGIMQTMMCDPAFVSLFDEIEATRITADADIKTLPSYHSAMAKLEAIAGTDREPSTLPTSSRRTSATSSIMEMWQSPSPWCWSVTITSRQRRRAISSCATPMCPA